MSSPRDVLLDVLNGIANIFALLSNWLLYVADWVQGWPYINRLAITFESMSTWFADISWWFVSLRDPLLSIYDATMEILNWDTIRGLIRSWLEDIEPLIAWFGDVGNKITSIVEGWWDVIKQDVQNWINIATQGFNELVVAWDNFWTETWPDLIGKFDTLATAWDNFWTETWPTLVSFDWLGIWWDSRWVEIQEWVDDAFTKRESWWEGWQEQRSDVTDFFLTPLDWLVERLEDWFWGKEEL